MIVLPPPHPNPAFHPQITKVDDGWRVSPTGADPPTPLRQVSTLVAPPGPAVKSRAAAREPKTLQPRVRLQVFMLRFDKVDEMEYCKGNVAFVGRGVGGGGGGGYKDTVNQVWHTRTPSSLVIIH